MQLRKGLMLPGTYLVLFLLNGGLLFAMFRLGLESNAIAFIILIAHIILTTAIGIYFDNFTKLKDKEGW